jgi:Flp pilus assembly protein TadD
MNFGLGSAKQRAWAGWALAALVWAAGCSQTGWFLGKSEAPVAPGSADPTQAAAPAPSQNSRGAADIKNPLTMAQLCESRGQTVEAKRLYEESIRRHPQDPAGYHGLALLYAKQSQFSQAEPYFMQALALAPNQADLLGDTGYFYYLSSRSQEAERYLRRAVELEPNQPTYGNNLALVLGEQGREQESLALFRRFGTEQQACANMGYVYAQRGEYPKALEMYSRVLTQDPKDRTAATALLQISRLQEQQQHVAPQLARQSPQPPAVADCAVSSPPPSSPAPSSLAPTGLASSSLPPSSPPPPVAQSAIDRPTPPDLPSPVAACSPASAEIDLSDGDQASSTSDVRWPEGALDLDRSREAVQ